MNPVAPEKGGMVAIVYQFKNLIFTKITIFFTLSKWAEF